ncbi:MAG TPA: phosphoribosylglycinamide formyltransferase 2 [Gammaproteobacteria bacterium]|nr:phosphoribosylglycinamide formyltransferase 2 [Gammaproteobacteria bacterium]
MIQLGTPHSKDATRVLLLGAGELGKEIAIEAQRLGIEVIAVDRYDNAPAMQVAHRSHVISMLDGDALQTVVEKEAPHYIVPEIEAIQTQKLIELEQAGYRIVPSAKAVQLTMNRDGIRRLVAEELGIKTSEYIFADNKEAYLSAIKKIGLPCIVKPLMSSSGKGQSLITKPTQIEKAWRFSQSGGRTHEPGKVIIESLVQFDFEITLLTVRHRGGTNYCLPIGHRQEEGDYRESWQPQPVSDEVLQKAQEIALRVTEALGGYGVFGVEFFVCGDEVIFSEVSPRPHDTGLVTLISQDLSEFALHVRAFLGLPVPEIKHYGPAASSVILGEGHSHNIRYSGLEEALSQPGVELRFFGKGALAGKRRLGVALAKADELNDAVDKAKSASTAITVKR